MPVPAAPPPGATLHKTGRGRGANTSAPASKQSESGAKRTDAAKRVAESLSEPTPRSTGTNDLLAFLTFVEHHTPGSSVNAIVENYSSHGAYVRIGDVKGYVPLSLMADPAPRSAREFMKIGESITLVVESFAPARRSIDLAIPTMATIKTPPPEPVVEAKPKRASKKAAATSSVAAETVEAAIAETFTPTTPKKRASKKASPEVAPKPRTKKAADQAGQPAQKRTARKTPALAAPAVESLPTKPSRRRAKSA
jgi:hypothetical protein